MIALKALADWTLGAGLELNAGLIRLAVGGDGAWHADSLPGPFTGLPSSPWSKLGTQTSSVVDGRLFLEDLSASDYVTYANDWGASSAVGSTVYFKMHTSWAGSASWPHRVMLYDGTYSAYLAPYYNYETKYNGREVYASFKEGVITLYFYNAVTGKFDAVTPPTPGTSAVNRIEFGSVSAGQTGSHFWEFLKFKLSCQSTPFVTTSPTATMGVVNVGGAAIKSIPLSMSAITGASCVCEYDIDGMGWVRPGSGTKAELDAALLGAKPHSLNLRVVFVSDGQTPASMRLDGGGVAGGAIYRLPLHVARLGGLEVIEL